MSWVECTVSVVETHQTHGGCDPPGCYWCGTNTLQWLAHKGVCARREITAPIRDERKWRLYAQRKKNGPAHTTLLKVGKYAPVCVVMGRSWG